MIIGRCGTVSCRLYYRGFFRDSFGFFVAVPPFFFFTHSITESILTVLFHRVSNLEVLFGVRSGSQWCSFSVTYFNVGHCTWWYKNRDPLFMLAIRFSFKDAADGRRGRLMAAVLTAGRPLKVIRPFWQRLYRLYVYIIRCRTCWFEVSAPITIWLVITSWLLQEQRERERCRLNERRVYADCVSFKRTWQRGRFFSTASTITRREDWNAPNLSSARSGVNHFDPGEIRLIFLPRYHGAMIVWLIHQMMKFQTRWLGPLKYLG